MKRPVSAIAGYLVLGFFALVALLPLGLVLLNSVKTNPQILANPFALPATLSFDNFVTAWKFGHFATGFVNSVALTGTAVVVVLATSTLAGYVLAGRRVRTASAITTYLTMAMTVPIQLFIFPLYAGIASLNLTDNVVVVGVVLAAINVPFATFLMRTFFLGIPNDIEEAAKIDGVSVFGLFRRIMIPMVRPGLITVGVIVGLNAWNEYLLSATFLQNSDVQTVTLGFLTMKGTFSTDMGTMMAGALILIVPIVGAFIALQRYVVDGMASGAVKG